MDALDKLKPLGSNVEHIGHGKGVVFEYNTRGVNLNVDQTLKAVAGGDVPEGAEALVTEALNGGFYNGNDYPYRVRFRPTEKYPAGFVEVFAETELKWLDEEVSSGIG